MRCNDDVRHACKMPVGELHRNGNPKSSSRDGLGPPRESRLRKDEQRSKSHPRGGEVPRFGSLSLVIVVISREDESRPKSTSWGFANHVHTLAVSRGKFLQMQTYARDFRAWAAAFGTRTLSGGRS